MDNKGEENNDTYEIRALKERSKRRKAKVKRRKERKEHGSDARKVRGERDRGRMLTQGGTARRRGSGG